MAWIELKAADGHVLQAWEAQPAGKPRGCIVVLQEIFGVNAHIRKVCDRYASQGWLAIAPALFDRIGRGHELPYGDQGVAQGRALKARVTEVQSLADVQAAIDHLRPQGKVAVIGFCWGGTLAWLSASLLQGVSAAVAYYGTNIHDNVREQPRVPVLLHFGDRDKHIPPEHVDAIAKAWPQVSIYRYDAEHGFNCDERAAWHRPSADLAGIRTQQFLERHLC
jgi:carboxymethylenebutenolidase